MPHNPNLTISCIGDVMIFDRALSAFYQEGTQAFSDRICEPLAGADMIVANLETPITNQTHPCENKFYNLRTNADILNLFDSRFVFSIANNHILDYGEAGLMDTIDALKNNSIKFGGAGINLDAARQPVIIQNNGLSLGIICAADSRFQAATETTPGLFPARLGLLQENIREVSRHVDIVIVTIHAGIEFLPIPSPNQLRLAKLCMEEDVQVLSFHHAHCISGIQMEGQSVVFYGTGKYIFPYVIPGKNAKLKEKAAWRLKESAVWQVIFDTEKKKIDMAIPRPLFLDHDGVPSVAGNLQTTRILHRIKKYSQQIARKRLLGFWYLKEMVKFDYIWLNINPYLEIARRKGILLMLDTMFRGVKAQLIKWT